ncbi:TPA: hypothetical protein R1X41_001143 [Campylobacter upsaliensis]|nr:hypothetical protein [Campylobacter upsaliensis]EFT0414696.1 hypothetical protein [Campylobacter upsaliensis]EGK8113673.1 hypothetical protein [Campylobacter upsaliensis]EHD4527765.1 hypothetical protein [Campylobacter upsaliensis]EHJ5441746.1 hypothetical protein [Campylobacter upsaliensis]
MNLAMLELLKNIGLGLFVNGNYALLSGNYSLNNIYIVLGSVILMGLSIYAKEK